MYHNITASRLSPTLPSRQQGGFVLVVGLIVLLVLTILGVTAMRGTTLQTAMAGNMQDRAIALQTAEAVLRSGEARLDQAVLPLFGSDAGYYLTNSSNNDVGPRWQTIYGPGGNEAGKVVAYTDEPSVADASFYVEKLQEVMLPGNSLGSNAGSTPHMYRVTAKSSGRSPTTAVVLQSTLIR